ncbi:MAG: bifunctional nuclease family protein [Fimbriimonadaceae bacterium]|nr:bifunctional nuclease family protein [Fimbriimonadaceae bacterium]
MAEEFCAVELRGVAEDKFGYDFALLCDAQGRQLPIWMGRCQAVAIAFKLQGETMPRPLTHDLLCNSVERLGGQITRVLIDDFWQDTFYAKVCLAATAGEPEMQVDCRPSDGIAIAIRAGVPILVREDVLEEGKVPQPLTPDLEDEDDAG